MALTYKKIASTVLSSPTTSVTLSGIPATFNDLILKTSLRTGSTPFILVRYDNNSTSVYSTIYFNGSGASVSTAIRNTGAENTYAITAFSNAGTSTSFNNAEIYIPNYKSSTQKQMTAMAVSEASSASSDVFIYNSSNLWRSTDVIDSITIFNGSNANFSADSSFWLYGINNT